MDKHTKQLWLKKVFSCVNVLLDRLHDVSRYAWSPVAKWQNIEVGNMRNAFSVCKKVECHDFVSIGSHRSQGACVLINIVGVPDSIVPTLQRIQ